MKLKREFNGKQSLHYTLAPISKSEIKRRGLFATKLSNSSVLIALNYEKAPFKKRDNTTWGHVGKGGYVFGVCEKVYKNKDAYLIIEQPRKVEVSIEKKFNFYGNFVGYGRKNESKTYKNLHSIALSNKALFGIRIGTAII